MNMQKGTREHSRSERYGQRSADMWREEFGEAAPVMHVNIQRKLLYNFKPQSCWKYTWLYQICRCFTAHVLCDTRLPKHKGILRHLHLRIQKMDMKIIRVFIDHQIHTVPRRHWTHHMTYQSKHHCKRDYYLSKTFRKYRFVRCFD